MPRPLSNVLFNIALNAPTRNIGWPFRSKIQILGRWVVLWICMVRFKSGAERGGGIPIKNLPNALMPPPKITTHTSGIA